MSVLVFAEGFGDHYKKQSFEAVSFAKKLADQLGTTVTAVSFGLDASHGAELGTYGATKVIIDNQEQLKNFDSGAYAKAFLQAVEQEGSDVIVFSNTPNGRAVAPRVAAKLKAGIVSGVTEVPAADLVAKKAVFSGKGFANYNFTSDKKVLAIQPNSVGAVEVGGDASVEEFTADLSGVRSVKVLSQSTETEGIPLPEAELVVSAGRGLKGPENWDMIEEMANLIGAATACSRPVADSDWRPHHEHVGQTGVAIRPNLYIAIAISGAIQHLAGVNQSKVIVVINKDPEAPFFKDADYGIVGDAFEIVPKLNQIWKEQYA